MIEHGVTGFICDDEDGLVEAVHRVPEIDLARCRIKAEQRFSPAAMTDSYEKIYCRLVLRNANGSGNIHSAKRLRRTAAA